MPKSPLASSIVFGAVLQLIVVGVGWLIPAVGLSGNVFPVASAVIAALAGVRVTRRSPRRPMGATLRGGGLAGGGGTLLAAIGAVVVPVVAGPPAQVVAIATVTGAVAGLLGSALGRLLPPRAPAVESMFVAPRTDQVFRG